MTGRSYGRRFLALFAGVAITAAMVTGTVAHHGGANHRPHMGSSTVTEAGTDWWDYAPGMSNWTVNRWEVCRRVVYFYISTTIPTAERAAIRAGILAWDQNGTCGPDWVEATSDPAIGLRFDTGDSIQCGSLVTNFVGYACRVSAASASNQKWVVRLHSSLGFGIGVSGKYDWQSVALDEMGHVMYADHNPLWTDSVVQSNTCKWGSTSCWAFNNQGFAGYTVNCANCGNRRTRLAGDSALTVHIYGVNLNGPPSVAGPSTRQGASSATVNTGPIGAGTFPAPAR